MRTIINYGIAKVLVLSLTVIFFACGDDETSTITFEQISSTYDEANGTGEVTITLRTDGSVSADDISLEFDGTATEGEDFEVVSFSDESLVISVIDDDDLEDTEYVRIRMVSDDDEVGGNPFHTLSILSNCEDIDGLVADYFAGDYDALEDYGGGSTYGPYDVTLVQDDVNPNRFDFDNFYDSGYDAYIVFDLANGTVSFPNQNAGGDATNPGISASTGTFDLCENTLTINLTYDGGPWVYRFTKH